MGWVIRLRCQNQRDPTSSRQRTEVGHRRTAQQRRLLNLHSIQYQPFPQQYANSSPKNNGRFVAAAGGCNSRNIASYKHDKSARANERALCFSEKQCISGTGKRIGLSGVATTDCNERGRRGEEWTAMYLPLAISAVAATTAGDHPNRSNRGGDSGNGGFAAGLLLLLCGTKPAHHTGMLQGRGGPPRSEL